MVKNNQKWSKTARLTKIGQKNRNGPKMAINDEQGWKRPQIVDLTKKDQKGRNVTKVVKNTRFSRNRPKNVKMAETLQKYPKLT